jgi:hypothetical protein
VEVVDEDPVRSGIALGRHLGERIGVVVVLPWDMMQLNSLKFVL